MSKLEKLKEKAKSLEAREPSKAIEAWVEVLKGQEEDGDPNPDLSIFNRVGDLYLKIKDPAQAADYYDKAVDRYAELGFHNNAIAMCNKVLRNAPGRQTTYLKLAKLYASKGFMAEAKQNFVEYAERMQRIGKIQHAFAALKEFTDISPELTHLRQMLEEHLAMYGDAERRPSTRVAPSAAPPERHENLAKSGSHKTSSLVFLDVDAPPGAKGKTAPRAAVPPPRPPEPQPAPDLEPLANNLVESVTPEPDTSLEIETTSLVEGLMSSATDVGGGGGGVLEGFETTVAEFGQVKLDDGVGDVPSVRDDVRVDDVARMAELEPTVPLEADGIEPEADAELEASLEQATEIEPRPPSPPPPPPSAPSAGARPGLHKVAPPKGPAPSVTPPKGAPVSPKGPGVPAGGGSVAPRPGVGSPPRGGVPKPAAPRSQPPAPPPPAVKPVIPRRPAATPPPPVAPASPGRPARPVPAGSGSAAHPTPPAPPKRKTLVEVPPLELEPDFDTGATAAGHDVDDQPLAVEDIPPTGGFAETEEVTPAPPAEKRRSAFIDLGIDGGVVNQADMTSSLVFANIEATPVAPTIEELEARVADDPDDPAGHQALGEALVEAGERDRGIEELDLATAGFENAGNLRQAQDLVEEVLRLDPNSVRHRQKQVEYAFKSGDKARLIDAYLELADTLLREDLPDKAGAVYQRVAEHDPKNERAQAALAMLAPAAAPPPLAPPTKAKPRAKEERTAPKDAKLRIRDETVEEGDFVDLGAMILEDEPPPRDTRMKVADEEPTGDEEKDFQGMLTRFKQGIDENIDETDFQSHYDLGIAFKEMGLLDEAIGELQKALRAPEGKLRTSEALGVCFIEKRAYGVAESILRRGLELPASGDQERLGVLYWLGRALEEQGKKAEARELYGRVFAVDIRFKDVGERTKALAKAK
jgi:tetratricopeptide (TPR) repeat protein